MYFLERHPAEIRIERFLIVEVLFRFLFWLLLGFFFFFASSSTLLAETSVTT